MNSRLVLLVLLASLVATVSASSTENELPFVLHRNFLILVHGSIGDAHNLTFVLDTGASRTTVSNELTSGLPGVQDTVMAFSQTLAARRVTLPDLRMGPLSVPDLPVIAIDFTEIRRNFGARIDAIIGIDVLRRTNFAVDFRSKRIRFDEVAPMRYDAAIEPRLPYLVVRTIADGKTVFMELDTGADTNLLFAAITEGTTSKAGHAGGSDRVRRARITKLLVGNNVVKNLDAFAMDISGQDFHAFDGILAARTLHASRIAFDFEHMRVGWEE